MVSVIPDNVDVNRVELMENKLYLVGSSKLEHKMPVKKILQEYPLLYRENGSATRNAMESFINEKDNVMSYIFSTPLQLLTIIFIKKRSSRIQYSSSLFRGIIS